jgi:hypothetical protein
MFVAYFVWVDCSDGHALVLNHDFIEFISCFLLLTATYPSARFAGNRSRTANMFQAIRAFLYRHRRKFIALGVTSAGGFQAHKNE